MRRSRGGDEQLYQRGDLGDDAEVTVTGKRDEAGAWYDGCGVSRVAHRDDGVSFAV